MLCIGLQELCLSCNCSAHFLFIFKIVNDVIGDTDSQLHGKIHYQACRTQNSCDCLSHYLLKHSNCDSFTFTQSNWMDLHLQASHFMQKTLKSAKTGKVVQWISWPGDHTGCALPDVCAVWFTRACTSLLSSCWGYVLWGTIRHACGWLWTVYQLSVWSHLS